MRNLPLSIHVPGKPICKKEKKNRHVNKFYLKKVFKHVLGRNNLTTEKDVLLWKAEWTLLLSVERFWIYGVLSVDDLFFFIQTFQKVLETYTTTKKN